MLKTLLDPIMSPLLYRVFSCALTVFFALGLLFGSISPARAQADDLYMVKGVMVDVSGSSALDARNKAFVEARRKAYEQLAGKLISAADRPNLVVPDDRVIASTVRDFEIVNEKMTSRRYVGTVDVRFTPAAVKRTIQVSANGVAPATAPDTQITASADTIVTGAPVPSTTAKNDMTGDYVYSPHHNAAAVKTAAPARSVLVLPWYGMMGRQTLWGQGNPWRAAWEENDSLARDRAMPILLPVGDVDDVRDYSPPQPLSRRGDIDALLKRYQASEAVLAMAEPNAEGGVVISLYRYENGSPVPMGRFGVDNASRDVMADAVIKAATAMRAMPAQAAMTTAPMPVSMASPMAVPMNIPAGGAYRTLARFSNLQEWVAMRQALSRVPGMGAIDIRSISPSQANVEFTYNGDGAILASAMAQSGLQMTPVQAGSMTGVLPGGVSPQYLLSMGRSY